MRAARVARLFFLIQTIEFLISGFINANARTGREGREARAKRLPRAKLLKHAGQLFVLVIIAFANAVIREFNK